MWNELIYAVAMKSTDGGLWIFDELQALGVLKEGKTAAGMKAIVRLAVKKTLEECLKEGGA
jgi:hypothetical protein